MNASIWTHDELATLIADWKAAYRAASTGKSYVIDGNALTRQDLPQIREQLAYLQRELAILDAGTSGPVLRRAVVVR